MRINAKVQNGKGSHIVTLRTNDNEHLIDIPPRSTGFGSSANGGELLFLALATCFCNDIYREAAKRGIVVDSVQVQVEGDFVAEGDPAQNIVYRAQVASDAGREEVRELIAHTDRVAEIQNTLRTGVPVTLEIVT